MELLSILEAAQLSGKSIQTIRRMIKQNKVKVKKQKTPQGFNYLIIRQSLLDFVENQPTIQDFPREHNGLEQNHQEENYNNFKAEFDRFAGTIQKLIEQNERDKENFFQLIKTFQDRALVLENKIKVLEAPKPPRWKFWL